jgi:hypothetical protein
VIPVTVVPTKYVRGWPRHELGGAAEVVDLLHALETDYSTDAHFAVYRTPNGRRLTGDALDRGLAVELHAVAFDIDCAATHGSSEPASNEWRKELRAKVVRMADHHPSPYYYETKGGARIVYVQHEPTTLRTQADAQKWSQHHAIAIAYLRRRYGIEADSSCRDWTRLYRLPRTVRTEGAGLENWPTWGVPGMSIGRLWIEATAEDVRAARAASKAFRERRIDSLQHCAADGYGLLYHLIRARGDLGRKWGDGYIIRCPNEPAHSKGRTGDSSTVLYLPSRGHEVGAIHCLHAHCVDLTVRDWLASFDDSEIERARDAAGIRRGGGSCRT